MYHAYAIFDVKAAAYIDLGDKRYMFAEANAETAMRSFAENCKNPQSDLNRYPDDFELHEVGEWVPDDIQQPMQTHGRPVRVCSSREMLLVDTAPHLEAVPDEPREA